METIIPIDTEFKAFNKIARLSREVIVTEKIDGSNASVFIAPIQPGIDDPYVLALGSIEVEPGTMQIVTLRAGSRNRWITPTSDNYGFAKWCIANAPELFKLGVGRHFGEWWGNGIQRNYGLKEKRFSLFNIHRWCLNGETPKLIPSGNPKAEPKLQDVLPACVGLVPVLWRGNFEEMGVRLILDDLKVTGSYAAPGFMDPEGIVLPHGQWCMLQENIQTR